jgi:hypothetical protein
LARLNPQLQALGVRTVAATLANPHEARAFCGVHAAGVDCFSDAGLAARKAFGLGRGNVLQLLGPQVVAAAAKAGQQGHRLGKPVDDVTQLPGTFLIWRDGRLRLTHYASHAGDAVSDEALLAAAGAQ